MKTISYYVSDYGYGHASRSIAIIRTLLDKYDNVQFIICTSFPLGFIQTSIENNSRVRYRYVKNDLGYLLKESSVEIDKERMIFLYDKYLEYASSYLQQEEYYLKEENVDFIISDISPFPFIAGKKLGLPTIGISNFTWYKAYQGIIEEDKLQFLKDAYNQMDYFIPLAGSKEPEWGKILHEAEHYFYRGIRNSEIKRLNDEVRSNEFQLIVYFGFGMKIDIDDYSGWKLWDQEHVLFIVSEHMNIDRPNVIHIPKDYTESQHYLAISDLVISKAGWSTVGEVVQLNKPFMVVDRSNMQEDRNTINFLQSIERGYVILWDELKELTFNEELFHKVQRSTRESEYPSNQEILDGIGDSIGKVLKE
ncbi:glycosyltransferase [Paenibacillus sp. GP183]|uniref:glycosyltransferase n=1 Tax=Paenibacillus sp. GP183 TaxID=1882751 RepID=UPI00089D9A02|nr:glycosyltransferase [Paenibacillus sp. GP183]SEC11014.1 Glycosyltransferase family 28 C-terminal domain-containing protein [Paenibacillus sp. GP183]